MCLLVLLDVVSCHCGAFVFVVFVLLFITLRGVVWRCVTCCRCHCLVRPVVVVIAALECLRLAVVYYVLLNVVDCCCHSSPCATWR